MGRNKSEALLYVNCNANSMERKFCCINVIIVRIKVINCVSHVIFPSEFYLLLHCMYMFILFTWV